MDEKLLEIKEIVIDGKNINKNNACIYRGLGAVTGNNSSRLLMDYKFKHPQAYNEIMDLIFKKNYGAGLSHIKIEMGTDVNSSSGTEPCTKRYENEPADVTRGAGFMLAADAKKINPEITVDLLRWGEPAWIIKAFKKSQYDGMNARYRWYIETINAAYDVYGLKFDFISADSNETNEADAKWLIYFSHRLKHESSSRYDYSKIKIIASDEPGTRNIAEAMMQNKKLRDAVDIIGLHYTTYGDENTKILNEKYGKEIWYSEGAAPCNVSKYSVNADGSGISGINSLIDIANRIINSYCNGSMIMYEYQPAIAAYYTGSNYAPKQLIRAEEPWSGHYEICSGLWGAAHFTHFIEKGWHYVNDACYGDGEERHYITNTNNNYLTLTSDKGDYTIILTNNTSRTRKYKIIVKNIKKADSYIHCIETRGPDNGGKYNENWFKNTNKIIPAAEKSNIYYYNIEVKPFSILTCTTLGTENIEGINSVKKSNHIYSKLKLPFSDKYDYSVDFLKSRGYAPLYTTDQGGAFEVETDNGRYVLSQVITKDIIPTDWRFRNTPMPVTNFGDDTWADYSVSTDVRFASDNPDNYIGIGLRYNSAAVCDYSAESGYQIRIFPDGKWQIKYTNTVLEEGNSEKINPLGWNEIQIAADKRNIECKINKELICSCSVSPPMICSGRAAFYSSYYRNNFKNLIIEPVNRKNVYIDRTDCLSADIKYSENWKKNGLDSFNFYNRTSTEPKSDGQYFTFSFSGTYFFLIGEAEDLGLKIEIDNKIITAGFCVKKCGSKQAFYRKDGLSDTEHTVKVTILTGKLKLDVIETEAEYSAVRWEKQKQTDSKARKNKFAKKEKKLKISTLLIGAGLAAAGTAAILINKKIKKISEKN